MKIISVSTIKRGVITWDSVFCKNLQGSSHRLKAVGSVYDNRKDFIYELSYLFFILFIIPFASLKAQTRHEGNFITLQYKISFTLTSPYFFL